MRLSVVPPPTRPRPAALAVMSSSRYFCAMIASRCSWAMAAPARPKACPDESSKTLQPCETMDPMELPPAPAQAMPT